jgi:hypothetical protein
MPVSGLRERMMCRRWGNRRVNLIFEPPPVAKRAPLAGCTRGTHWPVYPRGGAWG